MLFHQQIYAVKEVTTMKEKRCSHHKVEIYCGECVFWGKQADKHITKCLKFINTF